MAAGSFGELGKKMSKDPIADETVPDKRTAMRLARTMGCEGAHQAGEGENAGWHPCESRAALNALITGGAAGYRRWKARNSGKSERVVFLRRKAMPDRGRGKRIVKRRHTVRTRKRGKRWEKLGERGVRGIHTMPDGGLASERY